MVRPARPRAPLGLVHASLPWPRLQLDSIEVIKSYGILCRPWKDIRPQTSIRCASLRSRPTESLDRTRLPRDESPRLVAPFESAFQAHMAAWRLDGKPRTARRLSVYQPCPLPTPEDRLLLLLTSVKTY